MSKQIQIRRGTTNANDLFVGAEGEITMDTTTKGLRIHDGTTIGGFKIATVVMFQAPTPENGYTWYNKYADGRVEMGGVISWAGTTMGSGTTAKAATITFPVEVTKITGLSFGDDMTFFNAHARNKTGTGMDVYVSNQLPVSTTQAACEIFWEVKGMAA